VDAHRLVTLGSALKLVDCRMIETFRSTAELLVVLGPVPTVGPAVRAVDRKPSMAGT